MNSPVIKVCLAIVVFVFLVNIMFQRNFEDHSVFDQSISVINSFSDYGEDLKSDFKKLVVVNDRGVEVPRWVFALSGNTEMYDSLPVKPTWNDLMSKNYLNEPFMSNKNETISNEKFFFKAMRPILTVATAVGSFFVDTFDFIGGLISSFR